MEASNMHVCEDGTLGDLLMVIDMQNVYLEGQPWGCVATGEILERIRRLIDSHAPDNVIFTRYLPPENPVGTWEQYNIENRAINGDPWMNEMIEGCKPYLADYPLFTKSRYSSYSNAEVKALAGRARRVLLCGVVAECCVLFTLLSGIDAGDKMVYLKDACSGVSREHERMVEAIAACYAPMHTEVMTCEEYMESKKPDS
ncbi:MAG: cysteine hydrolase [Roseburia sp.]|nr:cysteine hydrolase [Roseburia sp.]